MISYFRYWDAKRRLESSKKTIEMMGESSNYMLDAQKEMIEREVEYYKEESNKLTFVLLTFFLTFAIIAVLYTKGIIHYVNSRLV